MQTPEQQAKKFIKTAKQRELIDTMNQHHYSLAYGGSRSGKTTGIVRNMILRGIHHPSRHLIVRHRFNHAKTSLMYDTIPKVFGMCFPGLKYDENKSDSFYSWRSQSGGESQLWVGGIDDKERVEKILGNEYSTIAANEISQIEFDAISMLQTRLAESSGLKLRFYMDCNPPPKSHWSYRYFHFGENPDGSKHGMDIGYCVLNPMDNLANLPPDYIKILEGLPKRKRERFLLGLFLQDVEGALWTDQIINASQARGYGEIVETVIAVDPATTDNPGSDECGIVVCSLDEFGGGVVQADWSKQTSTKRWSQMVVNAFHEYEANHVVAETNQGGDLVAQAIHGIDPNIPVLSVHAAKGKRARAEPVAMLYDQGRISHEPGLMKLEEEMTTWLPREQKWSPNRIDAMVWGFWDLFDIDKSVKNKREFRLGII